MTYVGTTPLSSTLEELRSLPLTIDGVHFIGDKRNVFIGRYQHQEGFLGDLARFLADWRSASPVMQVQTSGSTGTPQVIQVEKTRMANSARATCTALRLKSGMSAMLAMPLRYIAARMVVVRALLADLNLVPVTPSSSPFRNIEQHIDFAALTPMQTYTSLETPDTAEKLRSVRCLLLGGGAISSSLAAKLAEFPHEVWSSYGMTETLSHIALRRLNGPNKSDWYTPLPGVSVSLTEEGTLSIHAPMVTAGDLVTTDLAEVDERGHFRILGRRDNIINSGGIKIQLEEVEELLAPVLKKPFCVSAVPDARLGEKLCLLHTGGEEPAVLDTLCRHVLPKYWVPRAYFAIAEVPLTETGKIRRKEARKMAEKLAQKK